MTAKVSCFAQELWAFQAASFLYLKIFLFAYYHVFVSFLVFDYYCCYNNTQITRHEYFCGKIFSMHTKKLSLLSVGKFCVSLRYNLMNVLDEKKKRRRE